MLTADADLHAGPTLAPLVHRHLHQPSDAGPVEGGEWVDGENLLLDVLEQELAFGVVAREPERRLGQVIGPEGEELGKLGDLPGGETGARNLHHRAELVLDLGLLFLEDLGYY